MADADSTRFVMHGARAAMANGLLHIETQVDAIEDAVASKPGLAFDLARTLVESTCRTILADRKVAFDPGEDLPALFKTVRNCLPFLPPSESGSSDVRRSIAQTLGGLSAAVQGICELRNACGFASHGSDAARPALEATQALLAAEAADTIVGFLFRVHRQDGSVPPDVRRSYYDNPDFNEYVDEVHERVRIFAEDFTPSRILFELAPEPYRVYLSDYKLEVEDKDDRPETTATGPEGGPASIAVSGSTSSEVTQ
jgi:hypothetical protein